MKFLYLALLISGGLLNYACSKSEFSSSSKRQTSSEKEKEASNSSNAESIGGEVVTQTFDLNTLTYSVSAPSQYLYILDNSGSMRSQIEKVTDGIAGIPKSTYPDNAEIGVMTTMASDYNDLSVPHPGIRQYEDIEKEPGYLDLVDAASIQNFKGSNAPDGKKDEFSLAGCNKWFSPDEKNANGDSCIRAHMQVSLTGIRCEPGMHAFEQLTQKMPANFFKKGHRLQVIFISDEGGPGCGNQDLLNRCPDLKKLKNAAFSNTKDLLDVRFHGIINSNDKGCDYGTVIDANNGKRLEMKEASQAEFKDVIESIVTEKFEEQTTITLEREAISIKSIVINDKEYTGNYSLANNKLTITELPAEQNLSIKVEYVVK